MSDHPEKPAEAKKVRSTDGTRHPFLKGKTPKQWWPEAVGVVKGYPKTQEAYDRRVAMSRETLARTRAAGIRVSREGVPDGWGGQKKARHTLKALALHEAKLIVSHMRKEGLLVDPDNKIANEALECAIALHRDPGSAGALKLAAARTVLEWTRAKPATKVEQTVRRAEDFLAELAKDAILGEP